MKTTIGQQLAYSFRPFLTLPPKSNEDLEAVVADMAKAIDKAIADSEARKILQELSDLGIKSPVHDPVINKFNAITQRARTYLLKNI